MATNQARTNWMSHSLSRVGIVDQMFERVLFEATIQLVGDDILLAALASFVRGKQLQQVGTATSQDHSVGRNLRLANLIDRPR